MDKNRFEILEKQINRTVDALRKNNFDAHYVKNVKELFKKLDEMVADGASCTVGGSMTLFEAGVIEYIKSRKIQYIDRYAENADPVQVYRDALHADYYFTSSNAITQAGELYNMDGNGNRVAAIVYGPKKVIVIAGSNKIVKDLEAAVKRNREIAAPANAVRLNKDLPCGNTGVCTDCRSPGRFCCHELISHYQQNKDRIAVLILPDSYGY
ncbi:MAG: lactate utilization protein [Oscillospiraceae bacterium]|nr:lactate utilization protein [Oscillospiraceae bacterium]